ncbi:hypothetical protein [Pseudomonas sp. RGB]|jgi:hypothetical protein|uniref:hypothetical protein n=1 Tax=Pseudomonas sp. RGB TaxID=2598474 RepID=UPI00119596BB|nr:hypothetical protein [Pseudomonas sp. RGB]TVT87505.1 hypothetical protein FPT15_28270 [Pseudomonas sp. RGB]
MAPRINTGHDKGYKCVNAGCGQHNLILNLAAVNDDDWTCITCGGPLNVMITNAGNTIFVRRIRARDVTAGDYMYLPHKFSIAHLVKGSGMGLGKTLGHKWKLAMEGGGGVVYRMPDEFVDLA